MTGWSGNLVLDRVTQNAMEIYYGFHSSMATIPGVVLDVSKYIFGDVKGSGGEEFLGMRRVSCL